MKKKKKSPPPPALISYSFHFFSAMNIEGLSLELNLNKMQVLQLGAGGGDLCAGAVGTPVPVSFVSLPDPWFCCCMSLSYPLVYLHSSNRVTKEVDSTSKEAKSFLKQQEKRQSAAPASLPTVSG